MKTAFADKFPKKGNGQEDGLTFAVKGLDPSHAVVGEEYVFGGQTVVAGEDGELTSRLRAIAEPIGRVHAAQLATSIHTEGVENVFHPDLSPGGSSGGSAVAVAGGEVDFATATDAGGSIRIPAALAGLFALKPTHGLLPAESNSWGGLSTNGVIAKDLNTTIAAYGALQPNYNFPGQQGDLPRQDVHILGGVYESDLHPANFDALNEARETLDYYGHRISGDTSEFTGLERVFPRSTVGEAYTIVMAVNVANAIAAGERATGKSAGRNVLTSSNWALREMGNDYEKQYEEALLTLGAFGNAFMNIIGDKVLLMPTLENPTPTQKDMEPSKLVIASAVGVSAISKALGDRFDLNSWLKTAKTAGGNVPIMTAASNIAGVPAATNPVSSTKYKGVEVPVSVQTIARRMEDGKLLALGQQLTSRK